MRQPTNPTRSIKCVSKPSGCWAKIWPPTTILWQDSRFDVPRDGEILILPEVEGIEFNPPRRVFRWQEDVHREDFRLRAHPSVVGTTTRGTIRIFLGVVILAEVTVAIRVEAD